MKHVAILAVCAVMRSVLAEHWAFGVDPPESVVLDKKRGEIPMFETIKYIELDVPKCFQIEFVSVNVYNLISNPITNFDHHADTVVITYKPWQISASMYDVVAKGRRKPRCKHQQAFEAHFKHHPTNKHTEQISSEELHTDFGLETNIEANTDSETTTEVEAEEELGSNKKTETEAETEVETDPSVEKETNVDTDLEAVLEAETDTRDKLTNLFLDSVQTKENEIDSESELETEFIPKTKAKNEPMINDIADAETESSAEIDTELGTDLQAATNSYELTKLFLDGIKTKGNKINSGTQLNTETEFVPKTKAKKAANKKSKTEAGIETETQSVTVPDTESEDVSALTQLLLEKIRAKARAKAISAEPQKIKDSEAETQSEEEIMAKTILKAESTEKTIKRTDLGEEPVPKADSLLSRLLNTLMRSFS